MKVKRFVRLAVFLRTAFSCAFLCTFTLLPGPIYAASVPDGFVDELVADGLYKPTAMAIAPDGRIFVCEQEGTLRLIKNDTLLSTPVLRVSVSSAGEQGLIGITLDPDFTNNQYIYIYYTAMSPTRHNRVSRFTLSGDVAIPGSETVLFDLFDLTGGVGFHNGGALHFGLDGKLYVAVGENTFPDLAQDLNTLHGKMLRLNKDGTIPADNPFYNTLSGDNRAIWAYGLRNPFTFAVHPVTGRIFINDVGSGLYEEINDGIPGANYGWPRVEGPTGNPNFVNPIYYYSHAAGCAVTGGTFFSPQNTNFPAYYQGVYFFADWCSSWIRMLDPNQGNDVTVFATDAGNPVDLDVGPDGNLYYLARGTNAVGRIRFDLDCVSIVECKDTTYFRKSRIKFNYRRESSDEAFIELCVIDECFCEALKTGAEEIVLELVGCNPITIPGSLLQSNSSRTKFRTESSTYELIINCNMGWLKLRLENVDLKTCVSNPVRTCVSITDGPCLCVEEEFEEKWDRKGSLKELTLIATEACSR
ncbi:MAG TPA: PQQ-dependent sugar dehydrogenase [Candidatus Brocadiia bacterium]